MNPARCLAPCAFHPGAALRRINDRAQADRRGRHLVAAEALAPLSELLAAARAAGHAIRVSSAFRSYAEQARLFRATKELGRAARPGHSEHQLGTAIDLRLSDGAALAWLAEHASDHGFVLSYPPGQQRLTGYRPEPWHVRFVGAAMVDQLRRNGGGPLEAAFRGHPDWAVSGTCEDCPSAASRRPCGRATESGACRGTVLSWCYDGALAAVDCAAFHQSCGRPAADGVADCIEASLVPSPGTND